MLSVREKRYHKAGRPLCRIKAAQLGCARVLEVLKLQPQDDYEQPWRTHLRKTKCSSIGGPCEAKISYHVGTVSGAK